MTSSELLQLRKSCFRISTGSEQWNAILNGGFQSRSISSYKLPSKITAV